MQGNVMSGKQPGRRSRRAKLSRRRGAVVAQVAVGMTTLCGFSALSIDVGMMYYGRAELQRTVDAAALAAAGALAGGDKVAATNAALEIAGMNKVLGKGLATDNDEVGVLLNPDEDIIFGRATLNGATGKYTFIETDEFPNAVRVIAHRTAPLFFANIFGIDETELGAKATAVLIPRDIALVLDLSASHNDDSELKYYNQTDINLYDVWTALPSNNNIEPQTDELGFTSSVVTQDNGDGTTTLTVDLTSDASSQTAALSHLTIGLPAEAWAMAEATAISSSGYPVSVGQDPTTGVAGLKYDETTLGENGAVETEVFSFSIPTELVGQLVLATKAGQGVGTSTYGLTPGPTWGLMNTWGTQDITNTYNPTSDPGLKYLPYNVKWTDSNLSTWLYAQGYCKSEVNALMSNSYDSSYASKKQWEARTAVCLGLAIWRSGHKNGLWKTLGLPAGNNDNIVGYTHEKNDSPYNWTEELVWQVPYPYGDGRWHQYFSYVKSVSYINNKLKGRFGIKTFVNFLLEDMPEQVHTPELAGTPHQPMQAVKDASTHLVNVVQSLDGDDQVGMAGYGSVGYGPDNKPDDMAWLSMNYDGLRTNIAGFQAGMWTIYTNVSDGIDKGTALLFNEDHGARPEAAKVMILLTDGLANRTRSSGSVGDPVEDAKEAAEDARDQGVQIHTVSVGSAADTSLMQYIAEEIGDGIWSHAEGSIEEYSAQLDTIFEKLGGERPVLLID